MLGGNEEGLKASWEDLGASWECPEPAKKALKPAGCASEPAGRALEPVWKASELAGRASELAGWGLALLRASWEVYIGANRGNRGFLHIWWYHRSFSPAGPLPIKELMHLQVDSSWPN